ncbi:MAG: hypothetical protein M3M88_03290 [Thermoproteota archaeon]|nr:hypothetical protein [Thermoproteota archaeon]
MYLRFPNTAPNPVSAESIKDIELTLLLLIGKSKDINVKTTGNMRLTIATLSSILML